MSHPSDVPDAMLTEIRGHLVQVDLEIGQALHKIGKLREILNQPVDLATVADAELLTEVSSRLAAPAIVKSVQEDFDDPGEPEEFHLTRYVDRQHTTSPEAVRNLGYASHDQPGGSMREYWKDNSKLLMTSFWDFSVDVYVEVEPNIEEPSLFALSVIEQMMLNFAPTASGRNVFKKYRVETIASPNDVRIYKFTVVGQLQYTVRGGTLNDVESFFIDALKRVEKTRGVTNIEMTPSITEREDERLYHEVSEWMKNHQHRGVAIAGYVSPVPPEALDFYKDKIRED